MIISDCPFDCAPPLIPIPVCGSNNITYPEACSFSFAVCENPDQNITIDYFGICGEISARLFIIKTISLFYGEDVVN